MPKGELFYDAAKDQWMIHRLAQGDDKPVKSAKFQGTLKESFERNIDERIAVEFEEKGGFSKVRLDGEDLTPFRSKSESDSSSESRGTGSHGKDDATKFLNPYGFVPWVQRSELPEELRDAYPQGHDRLKPELWTGTINLKIKAVTPLLLLDQENATTKNDHKFVPMALDAQGLPLLSPTGFKGSLRAAYEAITGSRMGVFDRGEHSKPLTYRVTGKPKHGQPGRQSYKESPWQQLPEDIRPASSLEELSPADRVFGWVNQNGHGAYRGQLRIVSTSCRTAESEAIQAFDEGLTLAILGGPKPQQGRFYLNSVTSSGGRKQLGKPLDGSQKGDAYTARTASKGWKRYWHHADLSNKWPEPGAPGATRYYRKERDNQNLTVDGWVKPGTEFSATMEVRNLSSVELGALLWLLNLPEKSCHRLGYGKPLGFGSFSIEVDSTALANGDSWRSYWSDLEPGEIPFDSNVGERCLSGYKQLYESSPHLNDAVGAFLAIAKGHDGLEVLYPRSNSNLNSNDKLFDWFSKNERIKKKALPDVATNSPFLEAN